MAGRSTEESKPLGFHLVGSEYRGNLPRVAILKCVMGAPGCSRWFEVVPC